MTKVEELVKELCPNGVEFQKIGEVVDYEQPNKYIVSSTDYDDSIGIPVLTAGQTFILGYTNEKTGVYSSSKENPVIIFDDFTGAFKWVDFNFKVKSSAIKMLKANKKYTFLRYIFHCMGFINYTSSEHKRLWIGTYSDFKIPVPPLPVQEEIVRILDSFTELTAELTARKKQYEYYCERWLTTISNEQIAMCNLGDICDVSAGSDAPKDDMSIEKTETHCVPIISNGIGENAIYGYTSSPKITVPAVTVAARGTIGYAEYRDYPYYPIIRLLSVIPKDSNVLYTKYLYYTTMTKSIGL